MFNKKLPDQAKQKQLVAQAVCEKLATLPIEDMRIGIGTGSSVDAFINIMGENLNNRVRRPFAVSSIASQKMLAKYQLSYEEDANMIDTIDLYIDGADEVDKLGRMIKGRGGALTGEKILAAQSKKFWCIVDETKLVKVLGEVSVAVEVTKMARSLVARQLVIMGGNPEYREGFISDHGNPIIDVYALNLTDPLKIEEKINNLPGVLANGIFARNPATTIFACQGDQVTQTSTK